MNARIAKAVALVKEYYRVHGEWPVLPSPLVGSLDLTGQDIEDAVEEGVLAVVFVPGQPLRLTAPLP